MSYSSTESSLLESRANLTSIKFVKIEETYYIKGLIMKLKIIFIVSTITLSFFVLQSCNNNLVEPVESTSYKPVDLNDGLLVSTPEEQGINPAAISSTYQSAEALGNIYSLLVVKNNYLVSEKYFNGQSYQDANSIASVTKSFTSALTLLALQEGYISSLDQKMVEFFPEFDWQNSDSRKSQITIWEMLQMRSGYPWEEFSPYYDMLWARQRNWLPLIEEFPLESNPGTNFGYSNLIAHIVGIIVARSSGNTLLSFAQTELFEPLGFQSVYWLQDSLGYYYGHGDLHLTPRELLKFGLLFLNGGIYNGTRILPEELIRESLTPYSLNTYGRRILEHYNLLDYGYMWWLTKMGNHQVSFAGGHGGQLIVLVHDMNMVVVSTADYLPGLFGEEAWNKTKAVMELVGRFIEQL